MAATERHCPTTTQPSWHTLNAKGITTVTVDHGLAPLTSLEEMVRQIRSAVAWIDDQGRLRSEETSIEQLGDNMGCRRLPPDGGTSPARGAGRCRGSSSRTGRSSGRRGHWHRERSTTVCFFDGSAHRFVGTRKVPMPRPFKLRLCSAVAIFKDQAGDLAAVDMPACPSIACAR